ncbi:MAG TPA: diguanylate cyclase [Pirellulales bacterium]|nr:diguanylate cyclase [Pirellulales bacterium]
MESSTVSGLSNDLSAMGTFAVGLVAADAPRDAQIAVASETQSTPPTTVRTQENETLQVRLGIAGSLIAALRSKHEPTAQHCVRVALGCSAWAARIGLPDDQRDEIEVAAALHDIGKIGIPDAILCKPDALSTQEMAIMERHWTLGREVLQCSCASQRVLEILRYARSWYDGSRHRLEQAGEQIPLGARMLAIVDAFDSMMSDQVYRRAMSLERAYNELYTNAGTQFDPALVVLFIKMHDFDGFVSKAEALKRWLVDFSPEAANSLWRRNDSVQWATHRTADALFHQKLLDNMYDAVVFIDSSRRITLWNRGAERLTGISGASVYQRMWSPSLLRTRDERGRLIKDEECPIAHALDSGVQWLRRLTIRGRAMRDIAVDAHAAPVVSPEGGTQGLTLLLHDVSPEISLEERCQNLHELATKDPLTQVANRAEFDRVLGLFVTAHLESKRPCSLIMSDIDRFKQVNDKYGHQAGDQVIQSFARVLQNSCRPGDLVARYGGEEFAMLCADCDNSSAASRAEEIRSAFAQIQQPGLEGRCCSASFGVTEIQPGDTPDTLVRRADRGLYTAKESGRNRVVQLGTGSGTVDDHEHSTNVGVGADVLLSQLLVTQSPIDRSIEKLRGFIADHHAEIASIDGNDVVVKIGKGGGLLSRRTGDRDVRLLMQLRFEEERLPITEERRGGMTRTRIAFEIRPVKHRDRRKADAVERAKQILISFRSYLMASELSARVQADPDPETGLLDWIASWFGGGSKPSADGH